VKDTVVALLSSRKFYVGTLTIIAVIAAVVMVVLGKIPPEHLTVTIGAITATGITVIGSIAWEDGAAKNAAGVVAAAKANSDTVSAATGAIGGFILSRVPAKPEDHSVNVAISTPPAAEGEEKKDKS
jgi:hypothetical protein